MNAMSVRRFVVPILVALFIALTASAGTPRILIVGDSWAAGIFGFKAFEQVFAKHGVEGVEVVGATTALGGSRADQWASNEKGKLDALRQALDENPSIDIVHVSIGGNDFLRAAMEEGVVSAAPEVRQAVWARIWGDIETLLGAIRASRPSIHILLNDYDYLDPGLMTKTYGLKFPDEVTAANLNVALLELAAFKRAKAEASGLCDYIQHFGLLQYQYGFPPHFEKHAVALPGAPPAYTPFAGGDPKFSTCPEAMPDGVHPMPEGYVYIIDRCYGTFYASWLRAVTTESAAQ